MNTRAFVLRLNVDQVPGAVDIYFEERCKVCCREWEDIGKGCASCDGTGLVLTPEGRGFLDFIARRTRGAK